MLSDFCCRTLSLNFGRSAEVAQRFYNFFIGRDAGLVPAADYRILPSVNDCCPYGPT